MSDLIWRIAAGFGFAAAAALLAWRARMLSAPGAAAAVLLGTIVFGLGGLAWAAVLLGFFISSSLLSRVFATRKLRFEEKFSKGAQRDLAQVLANGGIAGLFVIMHAVFPTADWPWLGFAGALAAANADTWATELGVLSRAEPRLITSGRPVERGTSGAISSLGMLSALAGAALIAVLAVVLWQGRFAAMPANAFSMLAGITLAGLAGSLLDSFLGATVQAIYFCPACQKETERHPLHSCGTPTQPIRGWAWMDNDWVNGLCTLAGALIALTLAL